MVDSDKRRALKVLGATAAIASLPSLSSAGSRVTIPTDDNTINDKKIVPGNKGAELTISVSSATQSTIRLTNVSKQSIQLKHVHPGIVHAGSKTFDINSILTNGSQTLEPGDSREFKIDVTHSTRKETEFPRHLYRKSPQRVVSVTGFDQRGEFVNSSRSFYS